MNVPLSLSLSEFTTLLEPIRPKGGGALAVAVSGGADSLALAILLGQWCKAENISLTALTVDHGLRVEAEGEAKQVEKWLKRYDIPHVILTWQGDKPESNIQDMARMARYRLMGEWCQKNEVNKLFLAHHLGDQAETFLLRLFRGSGIDGLSAMKMKSDYPVAFGKKTIQLFRPLLLVSKERLCATLTDLNQPWIEDPSNQNETYQRVKVRKLLKQNDIDGLTIDRMASTASRMGRVQTLLQSLTNEWGAKAVTCHPEGWAKLDVGILLSVHEEIALRCLASLLKWVSGGKYSPRLSRLEALWQRMQNVKFAGQTLAGCQISSLHESQILISREISAIEDELDIKNDETVLWDGRYMVGNFQGIGVVRRLGLPQWQKACAEWPDLKKIKLHKVIRESLPCILTSEGEVILPRIINGPNGAAFDANLISPDPFNDEL